MKSCVYRPSLRLQVVVVASAICLAAPASVALAQRSQGSQGGKAQPSAAASKPGSVTGVVVKAPPKLSKVPPDKKAAFEAEEARRKAWASYRRTTPTATVPATATATATATAPPPAATRAENYPGLRSQVTH